MKLTLRELGERLGGRIAGDPEVVIAGVNALEAAGEGEIGFAEKPGYAPQVGASNASAVVVGEDFPELPGRNLLRVARPRETFIQIVRLFHPEQTAPAGVHPSAVLADNVTLAEGVAIAECVVVREGARIGRNTVIESNSHVGRDVTIGEDCRIGPNVTLLHGVRVGNRIRIDPGTVIGREGFGYVWVGDRHLKVPQVGSVQIDDDVDVGCNCCVDRATFGVTRVRRGTKIDNQVQVGHNDDIGEDTIIVSQVGLSGSVKVGKRVILAGQVGTTDHIEIGDGAVVGGATAVTKDVKPGETVWGYPSRPMQKVLKELASLARLPGLMQQVRELKARLARLEERVGSPNPKD